MHKLCLFNEWLPLDSLYKKILFFKKIAWYEREKNPLKTKTPKHAIARYMHLGGLYRMCTSKNRSNYNHHFQYLSIPEVLSANPVHHNYLGFVDFK